jgi:rare lipoprotein A (peptidoglycan hydrolase)
VPLLCTLAAAPTVALVAAPTAALARAPRSGGGSGGTGLGGGGTSTTSTTTSTSATPTAPGTLAPGVVRLGGVINASGDGITFTVAASGTQGQPLTITGDAPTSDAGAAIYIQSTKSGQSDWIQVATATIAADGSFVARWTPATSAQVALRAVLAPAGALTGSSSGGANGGSGLSANDSDSATAASSELATSALTIPIFKDAIATLYGPGFWGRHTACGQKLTHAMLGVASRTLKCGTRVTILYRGRELTVPVIDRGPFANGANWDLTMATAKALGIKETATVGTLNAAPATAFAARS